MNITYQVIKTGSGNDTYFIRIHEMLAKTKIKSEINFYPKYFQYAPWLLYFFRKKAKGNIVHSNIEYAWVFKELGKPLYATVHHNVFDKTYEKYISLPQKIYYTFIIKLNTLFSLKTTDRIIAVSNYTQRSFQETYGSHKMEVIYPPVDTDVFKPMNIKSKDKRFKLLFVGNLTKRKGADLLPSIMIKLGPEYVLYFTTGLRTKIPAGFNQPNMIPLGKLTEKQLVEEYNKCDALLFPSRLEGYGFCVVEAMACGKLIITSNSSSINEIILKRINIVLSNFNDINPITHAITNIGKNKKIIKEQNITHTKKNFSIARLLPHYEELYKS